MTIRERRLRAASVAIGAIRVLRGRGDGNVIIVPGGPPMALMAIGTARRRGVVLILHDSSQPATTMGSDWTPKGLCKS
jgi:hypothetical protein